MEAGAPRAETADGRGTARRLLGRPLALVCIGFLLLVIGIAIVAPIALPDVSQQTIGDLSHVRQGPSMNHLLGTDSVGRDVLNRLLVGTRIEMISVAESLIAASLLGSRSGSQPASSAAASTARSASAPT
jgi:peptide/nickel transport system permease protein